MHWFWRAAISLAIGTAVGNLTYGGVLWLPASSRVWTLIDAVDTFTRDHLGIVGSLGTFSRGVFVLVGLLVYRALAALFPAARDLHPETLCRKCGYILRGISEPRCLECGERI